VYKTCTFDNFSFIFLWDWQGFDVAHICYTCSQEVSQHICVSNMYIGHFFFSFFFNWAKFVLCYAYSQNDLQQVDLYSICIYDVVFIFEGAQQEKVQDR